MNYAELCERGHALAKHEMARIEGEMRIQGKPALHWVYEVARDCSYIDEVRMTANGSVISFHIDRTSEPPRITLEQHPATETAA